MTSPVIQRPQQATARPEIHPFSEFLAIKLIEEPDYAPYCMRCTAFVRMKRVEYGYWRHHCGAEADHRVDLAEIKRATASETQP